METCKIAICFDDGRKDFKDVVLPILEKYGLKCTCFLTTGYIDESAAMCASVLPALSVKDVQEIHKSGSIEIGCHGDTHQNDVNDILIGLKKLEDWLDIKPLVEGIGFASPGTSFEKNVESVEILRKAGIQYIRLSLCLRTMSFLRILARKICRIFPSLFLYKISYAESFVCKDDFPYIHSVPVVRSDSFLQLMELVKNAIKRNRKVIFMFHSVMELMPTNIPREEKNWIYSAHEFEKFCRNIADLRNCGKCQVMTVKEVYHLCKSETNNNLNK